MRGLFPLSAYSPHGDAQTGTKSGGEPPQEHAKTTTQNRANTPKSLTAQTEPRYYGQVPIRGCSLMVKPQSSKLITRVRFPSSPRTNPSDVVGGIFLCLGMSGIASGQKYIPSRARDFHPPARHPLENYPERFATEPFHMRIYPLARSESARSSLTYIYFSSTCCAETIVANSSRNAAIL